MATTAGSRPALRSSSISARCSVTTEPWCAGRCTGGAPPRRRRTGAIDLRRRRRRGRRRRSPAPLGGELVEPGGEPLGEPAGVGEHDRRAVRLDQVERRAPRRAARSTRALRRRPPARRGRRWRAEARSCPRPGRRPSRSNVLADGRLRRPRPGGAPPRKRATSSSGRTVADSPIRWAGRVEQRVEPLEATARGGRRAWCRRPRAPRRRSRSRRRAAPRGPGEVSSRNSDSGVVIRMSGGVRAKRAALVGRGVAGAHRRRVIVGRRQAEPGRRPAGCRSAARAGCARRRRRAP